jgi:hypothetical protein
VDGLRGLSGFGQRRYVEVSLIGRLSILAVALPSACSSSSDYHRLIEQEIHLSDCSVFRGQL